MVRRSPLLLALTLAHVGCTETTEPSFVVESSTLMGPASGWSVYEPHVAVTPGGEVRVAGQYGSGYNRGGLRFWTAASGEPTAAWLEREAVPSSSDREPTMAADATVAIGPDGTHYLLGLWADSTRAGVPDASLVLSAADGSNGSFGLRQTLAKVNEPEPGVLTASDKPWMIIDPDTSSSPWGTLYFAWTALTVHLDSDPVSIERTLVLSSSHDGGHTVSAPTPVAPEGMGVQLAVRSDGTLDVLWTELRDQGRLPSKRLLHAWSRDQGATFSPPALVAAMDSEAPGRLGHGTLVAGPEGVLQACWPQWLGESRNTEVVCNRFAEQAGWAEPQAVTTTEGVRATSYPALAHAGGVWWLAIYTARESTMSVRLMQRHGAESWVMGPVLASVPLPFSRFCPVPDLPCRRDATMFTPGDYVSAAGSGSLAAFAYVLPGSGFDGAGRDDSLAVSMVRTHPPTTVP